MRILSFGHAIPKTSFSNDDTLDYFRERNRHRYSAVQWADLERRLRWLLSYAGTENRYISTDGEPAINFAIAAAQDSLKAAQVSADEIDVIVYASVARGWLEPSMAVALQNRLGATNATCFDVVDACASWLRALHIVHALLASGAYKNALIVSLECGMADSVQFEFSDANSIERYFAGMTMGEAATATILTRDDNDDFYFNFRTFAEHYDLCMLPLANFKQYAPELTVDAMDAGKFMAYSNKIITKTIDLMIDVFRSDPRLVSSQFDICFSHSVSMKAARSVADALNLPFSIHFPTHVEFGNTAAASVPLAMSLAYQQERLKRGDRVLVAVGSAGITIGFASFTF